MKSENLRSPIKKKLKKKEIFKLRSFAHEVKIFQYFIASEERRTQKSKFHESSRLTPALFLNPKVPKEALSNGINVFKRRLLKAFLLTRTTGRNLCLKIVFRSGNHGKNFH